MKVSSSNPLVKDVADKVFCLAREHFNVPLDEKIFGETSVICYLEGKESEIKYLSDGIWLAMQEKNLTDSESRKRASAIVQDFLGDKQTETAEYYLTDEDGNVTRFGWIAFKVRDFECDIDKKYMKFDLLRLVANVIRVFSYHGIVKKENKLFGADLKSIYLKTKEMLVMAGTFNQVDREEDLDDE